MDPKLLEILVCPICKGPLVHNREAHELVCRADRLAFPVRDDIPVITLHSLVNENKTNKMT